MKKTGKWLSESEMRLTMNYGLNIKCNNDNNLVTITTIVLLNIETFAKDKTDVTAVVIVIIDASVSMVLADVNIDIEKFHQYVADSVST